MKILTSYHAKFGELTKTNTIQPINIDYYSKREQLGDLPDQKEASDLTTVQNGPKKRKAK